MTHPGAKKTQAQSTSSDEVDGTGLRGEERTYFAAASSSLLPLQRCNVCGNAVFYPRVLCPRCYSERLIVELASGLGTVYSFSVVYRPNDDGPAPYIVALIDLVEGPRMMASIIGMAPGDVSIGMKVELAGASNLDGDSAPRFTRAGDAP